MTEGVGGPAKPAQLFYLLLIWDIPTFGGVHAGGALKCTNTCVFVLTNHISGHTNLCHMMSDIYHVDVDLNSVIVLLDSVPPSSTTSN